MKNEAKEKNPEKLRVLEKIAEYERLGGEHFFMDVENDPPSKTLNPEDVDYLYKKFSNKVKAKAAALIEATVGEMIIKRHQIELVGKENLPELTGGAIITSNHFDKFESLGPKLVCKSLKGKHGFWRVIREGNYFMPGTIGFLLKYCNTLPISSNHRTMVELGHAIETLLKRGDCVLVYPEKAMWYNYKKPRPFQIGAFHYAAKNSVPVIPCFTQLTETEKVGDDGFPIMKYTVHIMPPIYPDANKKTNENARMMLEENEMLCRAKYEEVYGEKLVYTCDLDANNE